LQDTNRGPVLSSIAAIGSVIAAASCCLPFGSLFVALGSVGASRIFTPLRPYLLGFSVLALIFGFVQIYGIRKCSARRHPISIALLWIAAIVVAGMLIFPQVIAGWIAG
jgi:formate hydrogenlyase subunit 4